MRVGKSAIFACRISYLWRIVAIHWLAEDAVGGISRGPARAGTLPALRRPGPRPEAIVPRFRETPANHNNNRACTPGATTANPSLQLD
ncbi:hypothetical protein EMIT047CA2_60142 [Pseudomonas soli]